MANLCATVVWIPCVSCASRPKRGSRSWCPCAMRACCSRRLHSCAGRRPSWQPIWHPRRRRVCRWNSAVTCMCPTLACSPRPSANWFLPSMTLMNASSAPGSGTSSAWRPAPLWPRATWAATPAHATRPHAPSWAATKNGCGATRAWGIWPSGTTPSTATP